MQKTVAGFSNSFRQHSAGWVTTYRSTLAKLVFIFLMMCNEPAEGENMGTGLLLLPEDSSCNANLELR